MIPYVFNPRILIAGLFVILAVIMGVLLSTTPAYAFDPAIESSSNTTLYFSNNLTIASIDSATLSGDLTITVVGLDDTVNDAVEEITESIYAQLLLVFVFLVIFSVAVLGYWKFERPLLVIAGLGFAVYGFALWSVQEWLSIFTVVLGILVFIKAFWGRKRAEE